MTKRFWWTMACMILFGAFLLGGIATGPAFSQQQDTQAQGAPAQPAAPTVQPAQPAAQPAAPTAGQPAEAAAKPVGDTLGLPGKIGKEIAKAPLGKEKGHIDPQAPRGAFGIPGAPRINYVVAILWSVWVGWIFSTVGAFGGIMAGVGHMTVLGLGPYAKTFSKTAPGLNKALTDSVRTSNQFLVGLSALISTINYLKARTLAWPVGVVLALGSIAGAIFIPWITGGKVTFKQYQGWFGLFVFVVGAFLFYETTPAGQQKKKAAKEAAQAFSKAMKESKDAAAQGIQFKSFSVAKASFTFFGTEFHFNPIVIFIGGVVIAAISSFLGVGGGFLYVPFLTTFTGAPMYVVAGTSAMAVLLSMITSIASYITVAKAGMDWTLIGLELIGIFVGSMIGPRTQKYIPDIWLKRLFVVLAIYVGLGYFSLGFFGKAWVPM